MGDEGIMVIGLVMDFGDLVKVALKRGEWEKWWVDRGRGMGAAGFCGPCVCLSLLLCACVRG
jgi:hypothetical protein